MIPAAFLLFDSQAFAAQISTATVSANPPRTIPGLYEVTESGKAMLAGWDDQTTATSPQVLIRIPLADFGGANVRGEGFWVETEPVKSQHVTLPKVPASFHFLVHARLAQDELPRVQVWLTDPEGQVEPVLIHDGFIQSQARWRVVAPIPSQFRGRLGVAEIRLLNFSPAVQKRTVYVSPIEIIAGTGLASGSGLMDPAVRR
jgi:hypothetical protein